MSTKLVWNPAGFEQVLKSPGVAGLVETEAMKIASAANQQSQSGGYRADVRVMDSRVIASAYTGTLEAMIDNAKYNTLLRSMRK